jgi:putative transposase
MKAIRAWRYRLYPSRNQEKILNRHLYECKTIWNSLLGYAKGYYEETGKFPSRKKLYLRTKETDIFSQVAQNVADRLVKSLKGFVAKRKAGRKAGFPRFKPIERVKSFTYPQFGFKLDDRLELSGIGSISIRKHREMDGEIKTLTIKKSPSGKWHAIFTTESERKAPERSKTPEVGLDLGIEIFAYLSDGSRIENPRNLRSAQERLVLAQRRMSNKQKGSSNRAKNRKAVAIAYERLTNKRRDFLHKASRALVENHSLIAMEALNNEGLARGFLAKEVLDCSLAEFVSMISYKAAEAGCEVVLVNPAYTSQMCSNCGLIRKKSLAERWHECPCGASMHRDLNAAMNILQRATGGTPGSKACGEETSTSYKHNWQVSSMKQEAHAFRRG